MNALIGYIPIITTLFSAYFLIEIIKHYRLRKTNYLLWWAIGVATFGLGTLSESFHAIFGWDEVNLRFWYIIGALLGGFPLAQGSVYLLMPKWFGHLTTIAICSLIVVASYYVIKTPIEIPQDFDYRLTGAVFSWEWVRQFSPLINIYAFLFLFGGAIYSAASYYKVQGKRLYFKGNILIAIGALLPGIGGSFTRLGYVEVLFITELVGLIFIYLGYKIIKTKNLEYRKAINFA